MRKKMIRSMIFSVEGVIMNIVFYIIVIIVAVFVWFLFSFTFPIIGKWILNIFNDTKDIITKEEKDSER